MRNIALACLIACTPTETDTAEGDLATIGGIACPASVLEYRERADPTADSRQVTRYDAEGREASWEVDAGYDGDLDVRHTYSWTDDGQLLLHVIDLGPDGVADQTRELSYDEDGRVRSDRFATAPAVADWDYEAAYAYDTFGELARYEVDIGLDGDLDHLEAWTRDADGRLVSADWTEGGLTLRTTYQYDSDGLLTRVDVDRDGDAASDGWTLYSWSAEAWLTGVETGGPDPTPTNRWVHTLDAGGQPILTTYDAGADGVADEQTRFTYDASGALVRREVDAAADEVTEYVADGSVEVRHERTYDPTGRPLTVQHDDDAAGTVDQSWLTTYVDC